MNDFLPSSTLPLTAEQINIFLDQLVVPLSQVLSSPSEVVLHDLRNIPNTVRKISGDVTGREIGDPPTDRLLEYLASGITDHRVGYRSNLPDGRQLRSTTLVFKDLRGEPAAALCFNSDVSSWVTVRSMMDNLILGSSNNINRAVSAPESQEGISSRPVEEKDEYFPLDVEDLADHLIEGAIRKVGVPVEEMKKRHKVEVVQELEKRGFFLVKDSIDQIAHSLNVTRFTIYNYLNEITDTESVKAV